MSEEDGGGERGRGDGGPGGDDPRQGLAAIEGAVEILGETRGEREEMRRRGGKRYRQRRRRHQGRKHVREARGRGQGERDAVTPDQKLGRADRAVAIAVARAGQAACRRAP